MSYITDDDRRSHEELKLPSYPSVKPEDYASTEEYLKAVANSMTGYARLSYRRGHSATCQSWVYVPGLSDEGIRQVLANAVKAYTGEDIAVLAVHTSSANQEQTGVNLALKI